ncbi:MAG: class I tRNA ligase family protein, partial [Alphaproteobacteria bacterium]|nr:class I tRNA ligase family protein [Alphaproteobacteria bacterium]
KSKKNVVDPAAIIESYGADTARLYMLSDSPPDRDLEWTVSGIDATWRYVNRLWRLFVTPPGALAPGDAPRPAALGDIAMAALRDIHRTIADVGNDLDRFHFNKAVARIRELTNGLGDLKGDADDIAWVRRTGLDTTARLIGPIMPHLAEELWQQLGHETPLVDTPWPDFDPALIAEESVTMAVQVNGKLRGTVELAPDATREAAETAALALDAIQKLLDGNAPRKVIVVPKKVINVVV